MTVGGAGCPNGAVANALELAEAAVLKKFDRVLKRSSAIVDAALRAPDIDREADGGPKAAPGMTKREFRIAKDALNASRNAPLYLTEAFRVQELAVKLAAGAGGGTDGLVAKAVILVVEKPQYKRVQLHPDAVDVEAKVLP